MILIKQVMRWLNYVLIFFFLSTILATIAFKYMPVYYTPLMFMRCTEQVWNGEPMKLNHQWVPIGEISHNLTQAVVASEDNRFMEHNGFDTEEIAKAYLEKKRGGRERGASTISQQTAKNVFLWPGHSWVRKGFEVYFTVLIEQIWGKERIMEVYLNSIEMGNGIYGAQAIARHSFDKPASQLTKREAALVAATLPAPLTRDSQNPTGKVVKRANDIRILMSKISPVPIGKGYRRD